ncbi:MAG: hypothetical protein F6K18_11855 [Okeania sp. SIO2C2]|nr:hypothetical protein [Okeania sp. SIO2C2]
MKIKIKTMILDLYGREKKEGNRNETTREGEGKNEKKKGKMKEKKGRQKQEKNEQMMPTQAPT